MLNKFSIALFLYSKNKSYNNLLTLASKVHSGLSAMTGVYSNPLPSLSTFAGQITVLKNAIVAWGNGAGSKAQLSNLKKAVNVVRISLRQLSEYVMSQTPNDTQSWINAGFTVKSARSASAPFNMVNNLRQLLRATNLPYGAVKLKWERPLDAVGKKVSSYRVLRGNTIDFNLAVEVGLTTRSSILTYPPPGQKSYYWVVPYNAAGAGAVSNVLTVSMPL